MTPAGFPHSDISGLAVVCTYPELFAACHVLHRLPVPRHPPCALSILIYVLFAILVHAIQLSRCETRPMRTRRFRAGALKTGYCDSRLRVTEETRSTLASKGPRRNLNRDATGDEAGALLPRKEVIQPHLPVRLPCYDFTPLTLYTFGASLPCGLGQRLRVRTTRVV